MQTLSRIIGIRIALYGQTPSTHALYVANHISFIDILVISALTHTTFIAKNSIRFWPFIGQLASLSGVVFIKRGKRSAVSQVMNQATHTLQQELSLTVFPEGTTHFTVEPKKFHASLFQAAIDSNTPVQAICLAYLHEGGHDRAAAYVGDDNILVTLFHLMRRQHTNVHVSFCAPLKPNQERNELAEQSRQQIIAVLNSANFVETH
jgi:1-acyl-sn-glycerol-3-phosphate acyltransferase